MAVSALHTHHISEKRMEINFERPYGFKLDVIEIDERTPSFKVEIGIQIEHFIHKCSYAGKLWIECREWDKFILSLKDDKIESSTLKSISNDFILSFTKNVNPILFEWHFFRVDVLKNSTFMEHKSNIDEDTYSLLKSKFLEFPVWW